METLREKFRQTLANYKQRTEAAYQSRELRVEEELMALRRDFDKRVTELEEAGPSLIEPLSLA